MDDAAEVICSSQSDEVNLAEERRRCVERGRRTLVEGPVRAVGVVMLDVLGEDCFEVAATEDEHPAETLLSDGADDALAVSVGSGRSNGLLMTLMRSAAKT